MNGKNIFFGLCALIVIVSEISAMQLVRRRIPKSMYRVNVMSPMVQKRNINGDVIGEIVGGLVATGMYTIFFGPAFLASAAVGIAVVVAVPIVGCGTVAIVIGAPIMIANDYRKHVKNQKAAYTYVNQLDACKKAYNTGNICDDCICGKDGNDVKSLENIDKHWSSRSMCLQELQTRYNHCCFVEDEKADAFWLASKNQNMNIKNYEDEFRFIKHKKTCLYNAVMLIQKDMPDFQTKAEQAYAERLQLTSVSDEVRNCVKQQKGIGYMNNVIEEMVKKHQNPSRNIPEFKQLTDGSQQHRE